ncbi:helix-turn-helix domain-containing protein [Leucobacter chromiireducens]|uniref:DNA-binding protein n=1 Tax=Leucobacter chromiireducens subsp. chromiireducens TaxID=660067 RepID=A0ABS1SLB2_9MICO|nr:helix-turn-helix domain-containing protein [Leucobacter chromiireducens]MBL3688961.1 DNA-binding protein [Leucobacter chromiireducens subsp. chromiireducens]
MDDAITRALRAIIREEIAAIAPAWTKTRATTTPRVDLPIRAGEVERHYPVAEVARLLGMSRVWVYERMKDGTFVTANFGDGKSKKRIPASSINEFIATHTYSLSSG